MKKVIVRLGNGLGNQLFTYAAAYAFAKKNKAELYIDDESGFYKRHKYELHNFKISAQIIERRHKFLGHFGRLKRRLLKKFINKSSFLAEETDEEKLTYYMNHVDECMKIINNANTYVNQFKDSKREKLISLLVLEKYFIKTLQIPKRINLLY